MKKLQSVHPFLILLVATLLSGCCLRSNPPKTPEPPEDEGKGPGRAQLPEGVEVVYGPQLSDEWIDYLERNLKLEEVPLSQLPPEEAELWRLQPSGEPEAAEIYLLDESREDQNGRALLLVAPRLLEVVRPGVLGLVIGLDPAGGPQAGSGGGHGDEGAAAPARLPLVEEDYDRVTGRLLCDDPTGTGTVPLPFLTVTVGDASATTLADGSFDLSSENFSSSSTMSVAYTGVVPLAGTAGTSVALVDDVHNARGHGVDPIRSPPQVPVGGRLSLGAVVLRQNDCEIWRTTVEAVAAFHADVGTPFPGGRVTVLRWSGSLIAPHVFYDQISLPTDFVSNNNECVRDSAIYHELGHMLRHVSDGNQQHWDWDNVRWAYGRVDRQPNGVTNTQYAFNEGWANYWMIASRARHEPLAYGPGSCDLSLGAVLAAFDPPCGTYLDWNELRVAERLLALSDASSIATMVRVLTTSSGVVHSLGDFETRYCATVGTNPFCRAGTPRRTPSPCPPGYQNDPATCRQIETRGKAWFGRGAGVVPTACASGLEYDAGLCYPPCPPGFRGVGLSCFEFCPADYTDFGLTCTRGVDIRGSDNSTCPDLDPCGVFNSCTVCPPGYANHGCTCWRDADTIGKRILDRGGPSLPVGCAPGLEMDAGLCYPPCPAGWSGAGPGCLEDCPDTGCDPPWEDFGLTCQRSNVIVKF